MDDRRHDAGVAPDGSPVAVYLAMPAHDALDLVADQSRRAARCSTSAAA